MNIVNYDTRSHVTQVLIHALDQNHQWHSDIPIAAAKSLGHQKAVEASLPLLRLYAAHRYQPTTAAVANAADDALFQITDGNLAVLANESSGNEAAERAYKMLHDAVSNSERWSKIRTT